MLGATSYWRIFWSETGEKSFPSPWKGLSCTKTKPHFFTDSLPDQFNVTRYHSLELEDLPDSLEVILETESGENMAMAHLELPILGIQYHSEAHLTEYGLELVKEWVLKSIR